MIQPYTHRWSGIALCIGSTLFIVNKFNDLSRVFLNTPVPDLITGSSFGLLAIGQIALAGGCIGCYLLYADRTGRAGKVGLTLLAGGSVLLALGHITFTPFVHDDPLFILVFLGALAMIIGLTLFGVVNLRQPILAHWQVLPLASGVLGFIAFVLTGGSDNPIVFLPLRTLFGLSLVLLGIVMWQDKSASLTQKTHTGTQTP